MGSGGGRKRCTSLLLSLIHILTTPKQIRVLERYGFQSVGTWSFDAAKHMIDRIAVHGWLGVPKGVNPKTYTPAQEPPTSDIDFGW